MAEVQEVRQLPAPFIEALGKTYADELTKTVGGLKSIDVSQLYGPQFVAGPGALTTQAEQMASGLGTYTPYLQAAEAATGPTAYQAYMSPYQRDVIQTTLQEYDIQAQKGLPGIGHIGEAFVVAIVADVKLVFKGVISNNCPSKYKSKNLSVPIATYLLPSKSTNACIFLATPTIVSVTSDDQPPTFSGSPYLNLTLSESTHRCSAPTAVFCLSMPGLNA
jgi:hypothetical protein